MRKICVKLVPQNLCEEEKYDWMPAKFCGNSHDDPMSPAEIEIHRSVICFCYSKQTKPNYIAEEKFSKCIQSLYKSLISVIHLFENILKEAVNKHAGLPALFVRNHPLKFLFGQQLIV